MENETTNPSASLMQKNYGYCLGAHFLLIFLPVAYNAPRKTFLATPLSTATAVLYKCPNFCFCFLLAEQLNECCCKCHTEKTPRNPTLQSARSFPVFGQFLLSNDKPRNTYHEKILKPCTTADRDGRCFCSCNDKLKHRCILNYHTCLKKNDRVMHNS